MDRLTVKTRRRFETGIVAEIQEGTILRIREPHKALLQGRKLPLADKFRASSGWKISLSLLHSMEKTNMVAITYPHIVKENGQPARLEAHPRVRVAMIVMDYLAYGWSPDEIHRQHPHLSLAQVHAAMGYYYDHQPEIDAEITAELEEVDRALQNPKRSPAWLKLKAHGLIK